MTASQAEATRTDGGYELTLGTILWVAAGLLFILLRVAGIFSIPVGGAELDALAGAWRASNGAEDARYLPTLFQALSALIFSFNDSELGPRILALLAAATIPFAVYRLRHVLTEGGALLALVLLAFDAPGVLAGATATASAFDAPLAVWLVVLLQSPRSPAWVWAIAGFLLATAGALWLPLALGFAAVRLATSFYPTRTTALYAAAGALVGVLATSLQFGLGWDGFRIAPLESFAAGYSREWSTESAGSLAVIYLLPLLAVGVAAAAWTLGEYVRGKTVEPFALDTLAWAGVALLWLIFSLGEPNPFPLAALSLALAFMAGPAIARAVGAITQADWTWARWLVPGGIGALLVALAFALDWARAGRTGDVDQQVAVAGMVVVALGCIGLLVSNRASLATALLIAAPFLLFPHVAGVSGVAFGGPNEPMPSPISPLQAREIRDIAVAARQEAGGSILIHPNYEEALTWPLRNSGDVFISTQVLPDAVVLVWPTQAQRPDGFSIVDGEWAVLRKRTGPEGGWLDYLRWFANRNTLGVGSEPVAIYLKASE